jgi:8-oxo-dGTP pyrophosphatase MutT (NUDIX family)
VFVQTSDHKYNASLMEQRSATLDTIRTALQRPLPGRAAQMEMAVRPRPGDRPDLPDPCPREAAVLLLLYRRQNRLVLPLTLRTETVAMHRGQISLPGGAREPRDRDFAQTALRETCEELGIPELAVQVLGTLSPLYVPPSRFCVYPFIGYAEHAPKLHPDSSEVAEVIEAGLTDLLDPNTRHVEPHWRDDQRFQVPVYRLGKHKVWGATAMILAEFLWMVRTVQSSSASAP